MKKMRIAVIDSGISRECPCRESVTEEYSIHLKDGEWEIESGHGEDNVGHGTAVSNIIYRYNPELEIINIKISDQESNIDCEQLYVALRFVLEELDIDFVNVSAGITYIDNYDRLEQICNELAGKGVYIVSAFDNEGAVSYPSALESVIGVDTSDEFKNKHEVVYLNNSCIDLVIPEQFYRTVWKDGKRTILKGTSFACAAVTALLAKKLSECNGRKPGKKELLKAVCTKELSIIQPDTKQQEKLEIKKAIIFPVNKETHAVLKFRDLLTFELLDVYDEKRNGLVGKNLYGMKIHSYQDINWEQDFDTIILSCTSELSKLTHVDYIKSILESAREHGKAVYTFEDLKTDYDKVFYPGSQYLKPPRENLGKLWKLLIPVIGVFGTSSKQGKYTLQLEIKRRLMKIGYKVGQLATEPSGFLFGADHVFHFGYEADVKLTPKDVVCLLNKMIWESQKKGNDVLITGSQSMTLHQCNSNLKYMPLQQQNFLFGVLPDFIIVCVNPHDDMDYIKRTISYLNSIDIGKVYAIAIFPVKIELTLNGMQYKKRTLEKEEVEEYKQRIYQECQLPSFEIGEEKDMDSLCDLIIDTLAEPEETE